jgi:ElaB/YqjD/DUF883 family membrane-anchored ribosome-binding protein
MGDELEVISEEMEQTRSSLAEKLDALQDKVEGTVEDVQSTVSGVVEGVKDTAENVKESLNVARHVERRPWLMMGGAFTLGYLGGWMLGPSRREPSERFTDKSAGMYSRGTVESTAPADEDEWAEDEHAEEESDGILHAGLQMVKGLALGTVMGVLREMATRSLPSNMAPDALNIVDDLSAKLGAKPVSFGTEEGRESTYQGATPDEQSHASEMGGPMGTARRPDQASVGGAYRG